MALQAATIDDFSDSLAEAIQFAIGNGTFPLDIPTQGSLYQE